jgi:uncharacterized coiled-coil protein SlyX
MMPTKAELEVEIAELEAEIAEQAGEIAYLNFQIAALEQSERIALLERMVEKRDAMLTTARQKLTDILLDGRG